MNHPLLKVHRLRHPERTPVGDTAGGLIRVVPVARQMRGRDVVARERRVHQADLELGRLGIGEEGPMIGRGMHPHSEDLPVSAERHLPLQVDVASESGRDQIAGLVLNPFDRTFGEDRRQDRNDVAGVHRDLVAETTAEVGADDPDLMLRQLRHHGHRRPNDVRGLRGHVHGQLARCAVVVRD